MGTTGLLERLDALDLILVVLREGSTIFCSAKGASSPLLEAVETLGLGQLKGSIVVGRIVGKAAVLIIGYFKAARVYTKILSRRGALILDNRGIGCIAEELVEEIMNRAGTELCPFEKKVIDIDDPEEGYQILNKAVKGHLQQAS